MEFGLFYELIALRPHDDAAVQRAYAEALEQIQFAEEMGFGYVWETEHHFTEKFSYSSAPELFLTAAAQRTSKIRLGHGVVLLTMNHPVRAAERAAVLDILSNGRLEFGTGRGTSEAELGGFDIDPEISRDMWDEAVRMIPKMWTQDSFEHNGRFWQIPPRNVIPKPVQKPHPPMWVSGVSPHTFELAAQMGLGVLSFSLSAPGQSEKAVAAYKDQVQRAEPVGEFVNNKVAAFTVTLCLEDNEEAKEVGGFSAAAYSAGAASLYGKWEKDEGAWRAWYGREYFVEQEAEPGEVDKLVDQAVVCIGDPEACIRVIKHWEEVGVDQIMCLMQGGRIPHDKVMESIRLFGEHVIPYFNKRAGKETVAAT
ncbi:MAG: LLM class flavin-dependent oxidoreductase [Chloroflexi bacterium]|nr:LLM class flavin-dependent oxidoreductase [Chloroflexota bacterium]